VPQLKTVRSDRELDRFVRFPYRIYRDDPHWVAPLVGDLKRTLTPGGNPFWNHAERELYLVEDDGETLGRVAAIEDRNYNEYHESRRAFFGFFESVDDPSVSRLLLDAALAFARDRGLDEVYGPANPSMNDEAGMLTGPFDMPPLVKMSYNPAYYPGLVQSAEFEKVKDLLAFRGSLLVDLPDKVRRVAEKFHAHPDIEIRPVDTGNLERDLVFIKEIYNDAWSKNWDFAPMTEEEIDDLADQLKGYIRPELCPLVFYRGEPAGMAIGLPDYNQALIGLRGRLFPFGWLKFILAKRKIDRVRLWALGIKRKFHRMGLGSVLYYHTFLGGQKLGCKWGEMSWILEDNDDIIRPIKVLGGEVYKTYRVYRKSVVEKTAAPTGA